MDTKKTLSALLLLFVGMLVTPLHAQNVSNIKFCDRYYQYGIGNDSIHLYFNLWDEADKRISSIDQNTINEMLVISEDGNEIVNGTIRRLDSGVRIPKEYTFSVVLDQSIPQQGKAQIWDVLENLVAMAPDSTVYVSYYGDGVSNSFIASDQNMAAVKGEFLKDTDGKTFYSAVYAKLMEFVPGSDVPADSEIITIGDYHKSDVIMSRAPLNKDKNVMLLFAEGSKRPDIEDIGFSEIVDFQNDNAQSSLPIIYAFYYTNDGDDTQIERTLKGITQPRDAEGRRYTNLKGSYHPSSNIEDVISQFQTIVNDAAYDYDFVYTATDGKAYMGNVDYSAKWGPKREIGEGNFTIGSVENPWPMRQQPVTNLFIELLVAILVTVLTFAFFVLVMKALVPYIRSLSFKSKYYKPYTQAENAHPRNCFYCKQPLRPGQLIVDKCDHWMHVYCWQQNGFKCAEYGQNCRTGIQEHVEWKEIFKWSTIKSCSQTLSGLIAGLVSWVIYELCGRGAFTSLSTAIVNLVFDSTEDRMIYNDCVVKTSSFLLIGLLLGFFISLVFRYNDEVRDKTWRVWLRIIGLSVLTAVIGMVVFAIGADIFCLIASWTNSLAWYCSLPAYILFSLTVSLALTIKSTIPVKSALLGGCCSAVIGFIVLYFSHFVSASYSYLPMLLDFIIYGGGLGASLVTVRMLSERYFLVIMNGSKQGHRIPIHKWMNANGGGNVVNIGMTLDCEIQMNWDKSNKVAKEHAQLFIDREKMLPVIKPLANGVLYNNRADLPVNRNNVLSNGDTFTIGDTIFKYEEA